MNNENINTLSDEVASVGEKKEEDNKVDPRPAEFDLSGDDSTTQTSRIKDALLQIANNFDSENDQIFVVSLKADGEGYLGTALVHGNGRGRAEAIKRLMNV